MYKPNYNDHRVKKRIVTAIEFVEQYVFAKPVPVAQSQIHEHMARTDTAIGKFLKDQLLTCVDQYYNFETHVCKKYVRNEAGMTALKQAVGLGTTAVAPALQQQIDTGEFEYTEKSNRFFNPVQYMPRRIKRPLLAKNGYRHVYDIQCAAPTLLYQYAQRLSTGLVLPAIEQYLANRAEIRTDISVKYRIPSEDVKQIITSLFNGAILSRSDTTQIFHTLNGDYHLITRLQADTYLTALRGDISKMWRAIGPSLKLQLNKNRISNRDKATLYRELEREVMTSIKRELKRTNNKFLLEHDGWTCRDVVDIMMLRTCVRSDTGYVIEIDWDVYD